MEIEEINTEWLHRNLQWDVEESCQVQISVIAESKGLMGRIYRIECAEQSCILKVPPGVDNSWHDLFISTGLIDREVQSYRFLKDRYSAPVKITPTCYWSVSDEHGNGALALEDLTQNSEMARFSEGMSYKQAMATMRSLAILHSLCATINADPLSPPQPWMYSAQSDGLIEAIKEGLGSGPEIAQTRLFSHFLSNALQMIKNADIEEALMVAHTRSKLVSFCHGDTWSNNIIFEKDNLINKNSVGTLIDWQFAMWGNPLSDVSLLLLSSLSSDERHLWTDDLLQEYHTTLTKYCDINYCYEDCVGDYYESLNYSGLVALAMIDVYTGAVQDHEKNVVAARLEAIIDDTPLCRAILETSLDVQNDCTP